MRMWLRCRVKTQIDEASIMEYETLIILFDYALRMLYEKDYDLFITKKPERTFEGRLAIYLQKAYDSEFQKDFRIDIEYNREGGDVKRRHPGEERGWTEPDIILHRRNSPENIFCCELKLDENEFNNDSVRMKDAVRERYYQFGVNLYSIRPWGTELSVFMRADDYVREEKYQFSLYDRKLIYRNQQRVWHYKDGEWHYI